ncbi:hypothetical protein [Streptomyces sp. NPDC050287]|uniref:hypothetical protein n=1 Tax=Streptomyces sp. NPDC050287 TaxID=3365608 RepID=UPI00378A695A
MTHDQWLRQIRREAYSKFLEAADKMQPLLLVEVTGGVIIGDELRDAGTWSTARQVLDEFISAKATLLLEAPVEVREAAYRLHEPIADLFGRIMGLAPSEVSAEAIGRYNDYIAALSDVRELCRKSLQGRGGPGF